MVSSLRTASDRQARRGRRAWPDIFVFSRIGFRPGRAIFYPCSNHRRIRAGLALLVITGGVVVVGSPPPIPVEEFFTPPEFRLPKLAPGGGAYAIAATNGEKDHLSMIELATNQVRRLAQFDGTRLINYWWKGDRSILLLVEEPSGTRSFRTLAVDSKQIHFLDAFNRSGGFVVDPLVGDTDEILISTQVRSGVDLRRLNLHSGKTTVVQKGIDRIQRWITDPQGRPRAGLGRDGQRWFLMLANLADGNWRRVEMGDGPNPTFRPMAMHWDERRILGFASPPAGTNRVIAWNPADDSQEVIWQSPEVDGDSFRFFGDDWSKVRAVTYQTDRLRFHYFQPEDQLLVQGLAAALPEAILTIASTSLDQSKMILQAESDFLPMRHYLLDHQTQRIALLGSDLPRINPSQMVRRRAFTFPARDGMDIRGFVHSPPGGLKRPPAVLVVGSELSARAPAGFQPFFQLLANHGYAVVQIDHRGVTGYGQAFADAGNRQLSGGMVDDLIDGLHWLEKEDLVDPRKVAILGEKEAGWLALHAQTRYPEAFRARAHFGPPLETARLNLASLRFQAEGPSAPIREAQSTATHSPTRTPPARSPAVETPFARFESRISGVHLVAKTSNPPESHFSKPRFYSVIANPIVVGETSPEAYYFGPDSREQDVRNETVRLCTQFLVFLNEHLPPTP